jgi:DNA-binding transcriptional LysR family regulator
MLNQTDLSRADLNLLVLFEVVMEERHVGRSAGRLSLTSSAVSHGLKRLRLLLGDPLFLKTPRGVVPTDRAVDLAPAISDVLARVRHVLSTAEPFDPKRSRRRFVIGAPDGVAAVFLGPLLQALRVAAPGIDIGVQQLLPKAGETAPGPAWQVALEQLESRQMDVAVIPFADVPARFESRLVFEESFTIAMRKGNPFASEVSLENYCHMQHLVVSHSGDPHGNVDMVLAERGLSRRVSVTVPNFHFALAVLAETDLIAALPSRFVAMHGKHHGIVTVDPPLAFPSYRVSAIVPRVALMDAGLSWLRERLDAAS